MLNNVNLKDGCIITQGFTTHPLTSDHLTCDHLTSDHLNSDYLEKILRASLEVKP